MRAPHPLKMSVAHLTVVDSTLYEIELRIFIDDLIIGTGGRLPINPTPWSEVAPKEKKVAQYLKEHLSIQINESDQLLSLARMDVEELTVACYLRFNSAYFPSQIEEVSATNSILVDDFVNQRNVLHIELPNSSRKSLLFNTHERNAQVHL